MDTLRSQSLRDSYGKAVGNGFFFFFVGRLVEGVAIGAACLDKTDLVLLGSSVAAGVGHTEVPLFILLDLLGLVRVGLLGVCCERAGTRAWLGSELGHGFLSLSRDCGNYIK